MLNKLLFEENHGLVYAMYIVNLCPYVMSTYGHSSENMYNLFLNKHFTRNLTLFNDLKMS